LKDSQNIDSCSFCDIERKKHIKFIAGSKPDIFICDNCISNINKLISGDDNFALVNNEPEANKDFNQIAPKKLKEILDKYIIGQDMAKKSFCVGIYNHYKRINNKISNDKDDDTELSKSNILLIGPTGSGKTLMAQTMAKHLDVPLSITDATNLTEAGYVGEDVENVLTKLVQTADGDIEKAQKGIIFIDEIDKIARLGENRSITRDVSGEGVQQALLKIIEGSVVNIPPKGGRKHPNQDFLQIDTSNILFICGGSFDGIEQDILNRLGKSSVGFNTDNAKKISNLNIIEEIETQDLVSYGLIPELIGRLPVVTTLNKITQKDMEKILVEPKNSLIKQYIKLFSLDDVTLVFEKDAIKEIASIAIKRKVGARGLRTILENLMLDTMYNLPELKDHDVIISKESVIDNGSIKITNNKISTA
jgi:ATP-dependent Clp protease ATP-binding subunit ClpX